MLIPTPSRLTRRASQQEMDMGHAMIAKSAVFTHLLWPGFVFNIVDNLGSFICMRSLR
jgi:hypothetical protein